MHHSRAWANMEASKVPSRWQKCVHIQAYNITMAEMPWLVSSALTYRFNTSRRLLHIHHEHFFTPLITDLIPQLQGDTSPFSAEIADYDAVVYRHVWLVRCSHRWRKRGTRPRKPQQVVSLAITGQLFLFTLREVARSCKVISWNLRCQFCSCSQRA